MLIFVTRFNLYVCHCQKDKALYSIPRQHDSPYHKFVSMGWNPFVKKLFYTNIIYHHKFYSIVNDIFLTVILALYELGSKSQFFIQMWKKPKQ